MAARVQPRTEDQWLRILHNEDYQIRHRYYITRQMDPEQVGRLSWEEGRNQAHIFFNKEPWRTVDRNYVGVEKLTEALSTRLSAMIENTYIPLRLSITLKHTSAQRISRPRAYSC